jgi:hypothetical protein
MINALEHNKVAVDPTLMIFEAMYSQDNEKDEIIKIINN